jgi:hypothetical protein
MTRKGRGAAAAAAGFTLAASIAAGATAGSPPERATDAGRRIQDTTLISRALDGGLPNGPSTNAVISNDRRWARIIAFQSEASDLVPGDTNGVSDIFFIRRAGSVRNNGARWRPGPVRLVSRGRGGQPADGGSFGAAVDGGFKAKPKCIAFLSAASNLVPGDNNGRIDTFLSRGPGRSIRRLVLPGRREPTTDSTQVAVSGDCSRVAFVTGGRLYVLNRKSGRTRRLNVAGQEADPSFSTGKRQDLVFGASRGIYLSKSAVRRPRRITSGGRNPAYNDIKRRVVTYEKTRSGRVQIFARDLGRRERIVSRRKGRLANGDSRDPVIGNSGFYVTFETDATNLGLNALRRAGDSNGRPDVYLFTDVRDITLVQSVEEKAEPLPGGGQNPSMSFYANYIVFDSPAPLGRANGPHQIYMRWLGPV